VQCLFSSQKGGAGIFIQLGSHARNAFTQRDAVPQIAR
jgi:hypothetical protein